MSDNNGTGVVLIVEDDLTLRETIKEMLGFRLDGAEFMEADNVPAAMKMALEAGNRLRAIIHDGKLSSGTIEDFINGAPEPVAQRIRSGLTGFVAFVGRSADEIPPLAALMVEKGFQLPGETPCVFSKPVQVGSVISRTAEIFETRPNGVDPEQVTRRADLGGNRGGGAGGFGPRLQRR